MPSPSADSQLWSAGSRAAFEPVNPSQLQLPAPSIARPTRGLRRLASSACLPDIPDGDDSLDHITATPQKHQPLVDQQELDRDLANDELTNIFGTPATPDRAACEEDGGVLSDWETDQATPLPVAQCFGSPVTSLLVQEADAVLK